MSYSPLFLPALELQLQARVHIYMCGIRLIFEFEAQLNDCNTAAHGSQVYTDNKELVAARERRHMGKRPQNDGRLAPSVSLFGHYWWSVCSL